VVSVGFADTCYTTNARPANVCLEIVNNVKLTSDFSFELLLNINESCTFEPLNFMFGTNATTGSRACSLIPEGQRTSCYNISLDTSCSQREGISSITFGGLRTVRVCPNSVDDRKFYFVNITLHFPELSNNYSLNRCFFFSSRILSRSKFHLTLWH
jgi:hypothetical protein